MPSQLSPREKRRFEEEIIPQLDVLYRMARSVCRNPDTADDIAQEAFMKALDGFSGLRPGTNSRSWLARIVHNTCRDHWRRHHRRPEDAWDGDDLAALESEETLVEWEPEVLRNAFDDQIESALRELPPRWRAAVQLVDVEGWSYDEAAEGLDMAPGTLRSALHRARKAIYERLAPSASALGRRKLERREGTA